MNSDQETLADIQLIELTPFGRLPWDIKKMISLYMSDYIIVKSVSYQIGSHTYAIDGALQVRGHMLHGVSFLSLKQSSGKIWGEYHLYYCDGVLNKYTIFIDNVMTIEVGFNADRSIIKEYNDTNKNTTTCDVSLSSITSKETRDYYHKLFDKHVLFTNDASEITMQMTKSISINMYYNILKWGTKIGHTSEHHDNKLHNRTSIHDHFKISMYYYSTPAANKMLRVVSWVESPRTFGSICSQCEIWYPDGSLYAILDDKNGCNPIMINGPHRVSGPIDTTRGVYKIIKEYNELSQATYKDIILHDMDTITLMEFIDIIAHYYSIHGWTQLWYGTDDKSPLASDAAIC